LLRRVAQRVQELPDRVLLCLDDADVVACARYHLVLASGVPEPLLYLAGIGLGVGALVGEVTTDAGTTVSYAGFLAPALLVTAVTNGAVIDTTFAAFYRLRFARLYESVLATPLGPADVARGELGWGLVRALVYAGSFLVVLGAAGLLRSWWAVLVPTAALAVGWAFAGLGLAAVTWLRTWQDTQVVQTALLLVFLFSATFFPGPASALRLSPLAESRSRRRRRVATIAGAGRAVCRRVATFVDRVGVAAGRRTCVRSSVGAMTSPPSPGLDRATRPQLAPSRGAVCPTPGLA
jgi:hypothetical protein